MNIVQFTGRPRRPKQSPALHVNHVGLAVSDDLLAKIENAAWSQKITRSEFIRRALEERFKGEKK